MSQRPALIPFHSLELRLIDGEGQWELRSIKRWFDTSIGHKVSRACKTSQISLVVSSGHSAELIICHVSQVMIIVYPKIMTPPAKRRCHEDWFVSIIYNSSYFAESTRRGPEREAKHTRLLQKLLEIKSEIMWQNREILMYRLTFFFFY